VEAVGVVEPGAEGWFQAGRQLFFFFFFWQRKPVGGGGGGWGAAEEEAVSAGDQGPCGEIESGVSMDGKGQRGKAPIPSRPKANALDEVE